MMDFFSSLFKPDIGKLKAKRDVEGLIKASGYRKDVQIRKGAVEALGEIGDVRAVEALGKIQDARMVEPLIAALKDEDMGVRSGPMGVT